MSRRPQREETAADLAAAGAPAAKRYRASLEGGISVHDRVRDDLDTGGASDEDGDVAYDVDEAEGDGITEGQPTEGPYEDGDATNEEEEEGEEGEEGADRRARVNSSFLMSTLRGVASFNKRAETARPSRADNQSSLAPSGEDRTTPVPASRPGSGAVRTTPAGVRYTLVAADSGGYLMDHSPVDGVVEGDFAEVAQLQPRAGVKAIIRKAVPPSAAAAPTEEKAPSVVLGASPAARIPVIIRSQGSAAAPPAKILDDKAAVAVGAKITFSASLSLHTLLARREGTVGAAAATAAAGPGAEQALIAKAEIERADVRTRAQTSATLKLLSPATLALLPASVLERSASLQDLKSAGPPTEATNLQWTETLGNVLAPSEVTWLHRREGVLRVQSACRDTGLDCRIEWRQWRCPFPDWIEPALATLGSATSDVPLALVTTPPATIPDGSGTVQSLAERKSDPAPVTAAALPAAPTEAPQPRPAAAAVTQRRRGGLLGAALRSIGV